MWLAIYQGNRSDTVFRDQSRLHHTMVVIKSSTGGGGGGGGGNAVFRDGYQSTIPWL